MLLKDLEVGKLFKRVGSDMVFKKAGDGSFARPDNTCVCIYGNPYSLGVFKTTMWVGLEEEVKEVIDEELRKFYER